MELKELEKNLKAREYDIKMEERKIQENVRDANFIRYQSENKVSSSGAESKPKA